MLSTEELIFWTVVLEKTLESPLGSKEIKPVNLKEISLNIHWKDWSWSWSSNSLATWCQEPTHRKRPWCWQRLKTGGEGEDRGWDGWMASPTRWTWVWVNQGVGDGQGSLACCSPWDHKEFGHNWTTELDLLWSVLGQLRIRSGLRPACVLAPKVHSLGLIVRA